MKKRIVALVMSVTMIVAFMPAIAFADDSSSGSVSTQAETDQAIKQKQVELIGQVQKLMMDLKFSELSDLLQQASDTLQQASDKLQQGAGLLSTADVIAQMPPESLGFILSNLTTKLDREVTLVNHFSIWLKSANLTPSEKKELQAVLDQYTASTERLRNAVQAYVNNDDPGSNETVTKELYDALDEFGTAVLTLENSASSVLAEASKLVAPYATALIDSFRTKAAQIIADSKNSAAFSTLVTTIKDLQKVIDVQGTVANLVGLVKGQNTDATIATLMEQVARLSSDSQETKVYLTKIIELQKIIEQQNKQANNQATPASPDQSTADAAYKSQLANAKKIAKAKPVLKSLKSKGKRVTARWKAVRSGQITYYQVYYKVKGSKAVKKKFKGYKAAARFITYKSKKLKKGRKCTFKVRGVYQITAAAPAGSSARKVYYTRWSAAKSVKVK